MSQVLTRLSLSYHLSATPTCAARQSGPQDPIGPHRGRPTKEGEPQGEHLEGGGDRRGAPGRARRGRRAQRASCRGLAEALSAAAASYRGRYEVGPGVRWATRLGVAKRVLGNYLQPTHYTEALEHEQSAPVVGLPRLWEALARFDIQAHRTHGDTPNAGNLVLATRTEGRWLIPIEGVGGV